MSNANSSIHGWIFRGKSQTHPHSRRAFVAILKLLHEDHAARAPNQEPLMSQLSRQTKRVGKMGTPWETNLKSREAGHVAEGWGVDLNTDNINKPVILRKACEIAGVVPGVDLKLFGNVPRWTFEPGPHPAA